MTSLRRIAYVCMGFLMWGVGSAFAQDDYPKRVVRILAAEVGGTNDILARIIARGLTGALGHQVIVENRGAMQPEIVARSTPDGHTLLVWGNAAWLQPMFRNMPYDSQRDLTPISTGFSQPTLLVVNPSFPAKSAKDVIQLAMAKPGQINFGVGVSITSPTLAAELFKYQAKIDMVKVNYRGTGPAITALLGGEVLLMFAGAGGTMPHVRAGRLRALAVTNPTPTPLFPDLPTVAASGLPGYQYTSVLGFQAPGKTPTSIMSRLSREIDQLLKTADFNKQLLDYGVEGFHTTPETSAAMIKADMDLWQQIIKEVGLRIE